MDKSQYGYVPHPQQKFLPNLPTYYLQYLSIYLSYLSTYLHSYLCSHFFSGDSYILLYTYQKGGSVQYILYYWLGKDSTPDEKGAAALLVIALDGGCT